MGADVDRARQRGQHQIRIVWRVTCTPGRSHLVAQRRVGTCGLDLGRIPRAQHRGEVIAQTGRVIVATLVITPMNWATSASVSGRCFVLGNWYCFAQSWATIAVLPMISSFTP